MANIVYITLLFFLFITIISFGLNSACIPGERKALLQFKNELNDDLNRLESWAAANTDCCKWYGIVCSNVTSHVLELHLASFPLTFDREINSSLLNLKHLRYLDLSNSNFEANSIPSFIGSLKSLTVLNLSQSDYGGMIPHELGNLSNLQYLNLASTDTYVDSLNWISGLSKLEFLDLSHVNLSLSFDWLENINKLPSLVELHLSSCDLVHIPTLLNPNFSSLSVLDLSSSRISSTIPNWFWNSSSQFLHLNLSHNQIHGAIPDIPNIGLPRSEIDLSSNHFEGTLPSISTGVRVFDVSNNLFSGSISNFLCYKMDEEKQTEILNLDNNLLTGEIPDCWSSWTSLQLIRLSSNNLRGNIPESNGTSQHFTYPHLMYLHLRNNSLSGELPLSLIDCSRLVTLDLGENALTGRIPTWLGTGFEYMSILSLRGNEFHGHIPEEICHLTSLQILDLAHNNLSGIIPSCIKNFTFMATTDSQVPEFFYYIGDGHIEWDESIISMKGKIVEYDTILKYVKIMDLSSNHLSGEIPKEVTHLIALQSLNLSNNVLSGEVPEEIGVMAGLEVLDLSWNRLHGRIPQSMTNLTFLSMLNLCYNNFSGRIPTGTQLQTFPASSFVGNEGLSGPPLTENSTRNGSIVVPPPIGENEKGGDEVDWGLYVSITVGFIVGFWSILCPLIVNRRWRHRYYLSLSRLWTKILLHFRRN